MRTFGFRLRQSEAATAPIARGRSPGCEFELAGPARRQSVEKRSAIGPLYNLKPLTASLGVFPVLSDLLLASCRPFLVLCFGSWAVPVPQ
jgi:hypothetical protein